MLLFLTTIKLVCEIALLSLLGQGLLYMLAGQRREGNVFYQLLRVLSRPFTAALRMVTPRQVADRHLPIAVFCLLVMVWLVVTIEKIRICVSVNMQACQ